MEQTTLKLFLMGRRVVSADLIQRIRDITYLEKEIESDNRSLRRRVARRLRNHRLRALQKLRLETLVAAGHAFVTDLAAWRQWRDSLHAALEHSVKEIGLVLPRHPLLQIQIEKAITLAARTTAPLTLHVNSRTSAPLQRALTAIALPVDAMMQTVVITDYLADDSCIIETPNGLYEANVGRELEAFFDGVKSYLADNPRVLEGQRGAA